MLTAQCYIPSLSVLTSGGQNYDNRLSISGFPVLNCDNRQVFLYSKLLVVFQATIKRIFHQFNLSKTTTLYVINGSKNVVNVKNVLKKKCILKM